MTYRSLILMCFLLMSGIRIFAQDTEKRLRELVIQNGQAEVTVNLKGNSAKEFLTLNFSVSYIKGDIAGVRISPLSLELFIQQKYEYTIVETPDIKGIIGHADLKGVLQWDTYPAYDQYLEIMKDFTDKYPSLCRLDTIGVSIYGKLVLALKISDNAASDEDEPEVFYSSTIHGDETGGFILMLHLADYLLKGYDNNPRARSLVSNLEIWINPLANPDGTYRAGNIISLPTRFNANEKDLNRNFPDPFFPYTSTNIQQKETHDMVNFLREHRFVLSANFHSGSEVVNFPWDVYARNNLKVRSRLHADDRWFYDISRAYADTVHRYSDPDYMTSENNGVVRGADWYVIYGGRQDFVTWELQGREVTIELDSTYITPSSRLLKLWEDNYRSLLGYLENALYGIHGKIVSSTSQRPVAARIKLLSYDRDSSHVYSDTLTGSFVRMVSPGTYNIEFTARGYRDTIIKNIAVQRFEKVDMDLKMTPVGEEEMRYPVLYPNPATTTLKAVLTNDFDGPLEIKIYNITGKLLRHYEPDYQVNTPLNIDISGLPSGSYIIVFTDIRTKSSLTGRFLIIK